MRDHKLRACATPSEVIDGWLVICDDCVMEITGDTEAWWNDDATVFELLAQAEDAEGSSTA